MVTILSAPLMLVQPDAVAMCGKRVHGNSLWTAQDLNVLCATMMPDALNLTAANCGEHLFVRTSDLLKTSLL
ncbi:MAG: hypothetical protein HC767_05215 [Akkermansiaceae bacterium]|nr:hypothetical protein [Akkermansiaceae bacterium]